MKLDEFWLGSVAENPRNFWVCGDEPRPAKRILSQQGSEAGAGRGASGAHRRTCWFPGRPSLWN